MDNREKTKNYQVRYEFVINQLTLSMDRLRNCVLIDTDLFANHWFFGGALDAPDPAAPGVHRIWEMAMVQRMQLRQPNSKILFIMLGLTPFVFCADESSIESILRSTEHIEKNFGYQFLVPWLGEGILISGGQKWKHRRRLLNASFHYKILENYCESKI